MRNVLTLAAILSAQSISQTYQQPEVTHRCDTHFSVQVVSHVAVPRDSVCSYGRFAVRLIKAAPRGYRGISPQSVEHLTRVRMTRMEEVHEDTTDSASEIWVFAFHLARTAYVPTVSFNMKTEQVSIYASHR